MRVPVILIVGKPGAGKSTLGHALAAATGAEYYSVGGFIREVLGIPDPHIEVDKNMVFERFHAHVRNTGTEAGIVLDCHPYPENYFQALHTFVNSEPFYLSAVLEVRVPDEVATKRLTQRPRPGDPIETRLRYYLDHAEYIERIMRHPRAMVIDNSMPRNDAELDMFIKNILTELRSRT